MVYTLDKDRNYRVLGASDISIGTEAKASNSRVISACGSVPCAEIWERAICTDVEEGVRRGRMEEKKLETKKNRSGILAILIGCLAVGVAIFCGVFYGKTTTDKFYRQKSGALQAVKEYYKEFSLPVISKAADETGFTDLNIRVDFKEMSTNPNWVKNSGYQVVCTVAITSQEIDAYAKAKDLTGEMAVLARRLEHLNEGVHQGLQKLQSGVTEYGGVQVSIRTEGDYRYTNEGKHIRWDKYEYGITVHSEHHTYRFIQHFWDNEDKYMQIDDKYVGFQY